MGAADVLHHLRARGVTVRALPDGALEVLHGGVLADADRAEIRAHKPELVELLQRQQPAAPSVPPAVRLLCGLDDAEIAQMAARIAAARRHGYSLDDSEVIADRLLWRDRTGLDMHACLECSRLSGRRCTASPAQSFDHRDAHELRRCPGFKD